MTRLAIAFLSSMLVSAQAATPDQIVTTLADSGPGSLREAIANAPPNGRVRFDVEGDIILTSGELLINKPLRILGGRQGRIAVKVASNLNDTRIFRVTGGPVKISDLTIQAGNNSFTDDLGAGIYNLGDLLLLR